MEIFNNRFNRLPFKNIFRIGMAAGAVMLASCNITSPSSERFNVECNGDPTSADFDENNNAIFITEIDAGSSAAVMVSRKDDEFSYMIDTYEGEEVEFIGRTSADGSADTDAYAVVSNTDIIFTVNPKEDSVAISVVCKIN